MPAATAATFRLSIAQNFLPNVESFYYMRLHGRNARKWWRHDRAEERYDYHYAADQRRSHPLLYEWIAVAYRGARYEAVVPFEDVLARTGLGRDGVANRSRQADTDALRSLLPDAVARRRHWVVERRRAFESRINDKLNDELKALEKLKTRRLRQLELQLERSDQAEAFKRAREERGQHDIDTIFDEYLEWIEDTMTTEPQPYIKVVCVITGEPAGF